MSEPRTHSRLILPAVRRTGDATGKRRRTFVIRLDTQSGVTIQRSILNPDGDEMRAALDLATDCGVWAALNVVAKAARDVLADRTDQPTADALSRALAELAALQARRSEP